MIIEKRLLFFSILGILKFSIFLSLFFSFVASQIELIDAVDRGKEDLIKIVFASIPSYFPDIFFLSLPISAFRFFSERRKIFLFLGIFGFSKFRFVSKIFLFCVPIILALSIPFFHISDVGREMLFELKGSMKKSSFFVSGDTIFFIKSMKEGLEIYQIQVPQGKVLRHHKVERGTKDYDNFRKYISKGIFSFHLQHYVIFSFVSLLNVSLSSYIALSYVEYGFLFVLFSLFVSIVFTFLLIS